MRIFNLKLISLCAVLSFGILLSSCGESGNADKKSEVNTTVESESSTAVLETTKPQTSEYIPSKPKTSDKKRKKQSLLIAHRGFSGQYPESTVQAFSAAFDSGFDGVECDVWETRNGDLLIQHDPTTTRTTGKKKYIWRLSKKKRKNYPIVKGNNVGKYNSTSLLIPTLDEVLKIVKKNKGYLFLHIKDIKNDKKYRLSKKGEKRILSLLKKYRLKRKTLIFGGKSYVAPFLKKGIKTGLFTSPKKKKQFKAVSRWCKRKGVNTLIFANMKNLRKSGGGKRVSKYLRKRKLSFGMYKTTSNKSYRYLCRIGAVFSMSDFDIR